MRSETATCKRANKKLAKAVAEAEKTCARGEELQLSTRKQRILAAMHAVIADNYGTFQRLATM